MANPGISEIYFWNNTPLVDGVYVGNNYALCTIGNCVASDGTGAAPNGIITVGQGFIVKTVSGETARFNNTMRVTDNGHFQRTQTTEKHRFWINLSDEENLGFNQILIGYMEGATNGVDHQIDGRLMNYDGTSLYNLIDSEKFAIQGKALPFEISDVVELGFKAKNEGTFRISLANSEGIFTEDRIHIYLKDKQLNLVHDLKIADYTFESETGEFNDRFEIIYEEDSTLGMEDNFSNSIQIYKHEQYIFVESKSDKILTVELFDLQGRSIYKNEKVNSNLLKIKPDLKGILIVKVQTQTGEVLTKKFINN